MKRVGGLFDQIGSRDNLSASFQRAAKGKRHQPVVRRFARDLDENLAEVGQQLRDNTVQFGPYSRLWVRDSKERLIHAPPFSQRVLHHAVLAICRPVFERGSLPCSYACRRGFGQHMAVAHAFRQQARHAWYLKMDIRRFYNSVPHSVLRLVLRRRFREQRLLALFDRQLDSFHLGSGLGIPMGALTSQFFANLLLDGLDHLLVEELGNPSTVRYLDDVVIWGEKENLLQVRDQAAAWLNKRGLQLKHGGEINRSERGVPFLGFVVYPHRIRVQKGARKRLTCRLRKLRRALQTGEMNQQEFQRRSTALFSVVQLADDKAWRQRVLARQPVPDYPFGDAPGAQAPEAWRKLEQLRPQVPFSYPEQEQAEGRE